MNCVFDKLDEVRKGVRST